MEAFIILFVCAGARDSRVVSYWIDTLVLKTEGNTYATLLHHPFLFGENQRSAQEVATSARSRDDNAVRKALDLLPVDLACVGGFGAPPSSIPAGPVVAAASPVFAVAVPGDMAALVLAAFRSA